MEDCFSSGITGNYNPMLHDNLSRVIRCFIGRATYDVKKIQKDFSWQPRFYDYIIHNSISLETIRNYIRNNPANWQEDEFYHCS